MNTRWITVLGSALTLSLPAFALSAAAQEPSRPGEKKPEAARPQQKRERAESKGPKVGDMAPDWSLADRDGKTVKLSDLRGNVVVLDFWATWCGPCIRAMPSVQAMHERFSGQNVKVFGVNTWERDPKANPAKFMDDKKLTYGLLLKGDDVAKQYGVTGIPAFFIIGVDGKVIHTAVGFNPNEKEKMNKIIEEHLAKAGGDKPKDNNDKKDKAPESEDKSKNKDKPKDTKPATPGKG
jgi:peroxiredoxin